MTLVVMRKVPVMTKIYQVLKKRLSEDISDDDDINNKHRSTGAQQQ